MKLILFIITLFLITITFITAEEYQKYDKSQWRSNSDNRILNEIIDKSDLTEKINVIKKLGIRKDRNFNSVLEYIYYSKDNADNIRETLLYYTLASTIRTKNDFTLNIPVIEKIFLDIVKYSDSLLRKEILIKTDFADEKTAVKVLSSEGKMLSDLSRKNGRLDLIMLEECRVYYRKSLKYKDPVLNQINDIICRNAVNLKCSEYKFTSENFK